MPAVRLAALPPVLRLWLQRLISAPAEAHCFLIVDLMEEQFLKYVPECRASQGQPLLLDVPHPLALHQPCASVDEAVTAGMHALIALGASENTPVYVSLETYDDGFWDPSDWEWPVDPLDTPPAST